MTIPASNKREHQEARRAAGITGCVNCRDTGYVSRASGGGVGNRKVMGVRFDRLPCSQCIYRRVK